MHRWWISALWLLTAAACKDKDPQPATSAKPATEAQGSSSGSAAAAAQQPVVFTAEERAQMAQLSPLGPVPPDPTNAYADDERAAKLGQRLFFDKAFSGPLIVGDDGENGGLGKVGEAGDVSCQTCHRVGDESAMDDRRDRPGHISLGTAYGSRNSLPIVNSAFYKWSNWGGRFDSQWSLSVVVVEKPEIMNGTRLGVAHTLFAKYRKDYDEVFPADLPAALDPKAKDAARFPVAGKPKASPDAPDGPWEKMAPADREIVNVIYANFGKAIAAYMRKLVSRDAPFDRFVAGDARAISPAAQRGLRTFLKHCRSCHGGGHLSDGEFHVLGVAQFGARVPEQDLGRHTDVATLLASPFNAAGPYSDAPKDQPGKLEGLKQDPAMRGAFRTKSLRNVALTAPYMHAGQLPTLEAVVAFYDKGGGSVVGSGFVKDPAMKQLGLSAAEQADLVELMKTFTGAPVPAPLLTDTSRAEGDP